MKIKRWFSFFMAAIMSMSLCLSCVAEAADETEKDYGTVKEGAGGSLFFYLGDDSIIIGNGTIKSDTVNMISLKRTENLETNNGNAQLRFPAVDLNGKNFDKLDLWVGSEKDAALSIKVGNTEVASFSNIKGSGWEPVVHTTNLITTNVSGDLVIDITGAGGNYCGNYAYIRIYKDGIDDFPVGPNDSGERLPYQDESLSFEERAADLVSRMTLEEKLSQIGYQAAAINRLGVHSYNYWREALHGVARQKQATSFPTALSMSNTWNRNLVQSAAEIISDEARGKNNRYDLSYWSPTVNMARDPRWGRNEESYGEDPYLAGQIGTAFVKGMQGTDDSDNGGYLKTIATLKHFAANNNERNRRGGSSKISEFNLRNYYTRVFQNITEEVMPASFMSSYNATTIYRNGNIFYNYKPSAVNSYLLQDLLRRNWGFDGYVTSDCGAGDDLVNNESYRNGILGKTTSPKGAYLAEAFKSGLNVECYLGGYNATKNDGAQMMSGNYLSEGELDRVVYELFLQRFKTGEFNANGGKYRNINSSVIETKEHIAKAEEMAEETWVLLENKNNILPLVNKNDSKAPYVIKSASIGENGNISVDLECSGNNTAADMISVVKNASDKKVKKIAVKKVSQSGTYEIEAAAQDGDDVKIYIWNSVDEMVPVIKSYDVINGSQESKSVGEDNYKVAVVGNFAKAALLGDYTGSPENITYPIDGIRNSIQKVYPNAEVKLLGTVDDTEELFNIKSINFVLKDGKTRNVDLSKAKNVVGMTKSENGFTNVTPKASAEIENVDFTNVVSVRVEMSTGDKVGGTLNISHGVGGPSIAAINSKKTNSLDEYAVCEGKYTGTDGGYDGIATLCISAGAAAQEFSVENYKDTLDEADVIIAYAGTIPKQSTYGVSGDADSSESKDRANIDFPAHQSHVRELGNSEYAGKTVLAMSTVGQMNIEQFKDKFAAVLWTSYNGQTQGEALGKILTGEVNPSGRLTTTWYKSEDVGKMEISNDSKQTVGNIEGKYTDYEIQPHDDDPGHTYQYYKNTPVYPFGYGGSYTSFEYSEASADKTSVDANGEITFTVKVKNSGDKAGKEVVQLYVKHPGLSDNTAFDSSNMPKKQLKGFEKVEIPAGGEQTVSIKLNVRDMYLFSEKLQKDVIPNGVYTAYIGKNASDEANKIEFTVTGSIDSKIKTVKAIPDGIVLKGRVSGDGTDLTVDNEINPRLSTVMTDEQILFDENKQSDGSVAIEYKSSDENIASVKDGKIVSGPKGGVATITASVTYNGETKTTSFPVVNQISIKVSAAEISAALSKLENAYKVLVEADYSTENWAKIDEINENGKTNINSALTKEDADSAADLAIAELSSIAAKSDATAALEEITAAYTELEGRKNVYKTETWQKIEAIKTNSESKINAILTKAEVTSTAKAIIDEMKSVPLDNLDDKNNVYTLSSVNSKHIENGVIDYREGGIPPYSGKDKTITNDYPNNDIQMQVVDESGNPVSSNIMWQIEKLDSSKRKVADIDKDTGKLTIYGNGIVLITAIDTETVKFGTLKVYVNTQIEAEYADDGGGARLDDNKSEASGDGNKGNNAGSTKDYWILYKNVKLSDLNGISVRYSNKEKENPVINVSLAKDNSAANLIAVSNPLDATGNWNAWADAKLNIKEDALKNATLDENGCADIYIQTNALNLDYFKLSYKDNLQTASYSLGTFDSGDKPVQYTKWGDLDIVLTENSSTGETKVWNVISDSLKVPLSTDYFAEADVDYSKIDLKINCLAEYKDRLYAGCDNGLVIAFTECVKCYKLKKVCDMDIKSMTINGDSMYVSNAANNIKLSMSDIGGDSIGIEEAEVLKSNGAVFVDVRSAEEFAEKSVDGSVNIPLGSIREGLAAYSKGTSLIFYCESGTRATAAIKAAKDMGFTNVYNLGSINSLI